MRIKTDTDELDRNVSITRRYCVERAGNVICPGDSVRFETMKNQNLIQKPGEDRGVPAMSI